MQEIATCVEISALQTSTLLDASQTNLEFVGNALRRAMLATTIQHAVGRKQACAPNAKNAGMVNTLSAVEVILQDIARKTQ